MANPELSDDLLRQLAAQLQAKAGIADLAKAYVAAMGEIDNVVKDSANPHFGSNYASLAATLDTIRPVFARNGLALFQSPGTINAAGDRVLLVGVLMHTSGQNIRVEMELPLGAKSTAQAAGSAITYARRYQAMAVGGIAPVDDDGNAASESSPAKSTPSRKKPEVTQTYSAEKSALEDRIAACTSLGKDGSLDPLELRSMKDEIIAFGDEDLVKTYTAKMAALKVKR